MLLRLCRRLRKRRQNRKMRSSFKRLRAHESHVSGSEFCIIKVFGSVFSALSLGLRFLNNGLGNSASLSFRCSRQFFRQTHATNDHLQTASIYEDSNITYLEAKKVCRLLTGRTVTISARKCVFALFRECVTAIS